MKRIPSSSAANRSGNVCARIQLSVLEQFEGALEGRSCNKSELLTGLIEIALQRDLLREVIDTVEKSKLRVLTRLTRDDVIKQLQSVENERQLLQAALASMDVPRAKGSPAQSSPSASRARLEQA